MIIMSDTVIEVGTVLLDTDDNTKWVVIRFDSCEDSFYSTAMAVSLQEMAECVEYVNLRLSTYYPFDRFKSLHYIRGNEWDTYEEINNTNYKNLFKPIDVIEFIPQYIGGNK